jgi:WD40 repeat protein
MVPKPLRALVLALLVLAVVVPTASAFAGRNGDVVYGWSEIEEPDVGPSWLYVKAIRLVDARGGTPRTVTGCEQTLPVQAPEPARTCASQVFANPAVSRDRPTIAFDNGASLALVDPDGSDLRVLPAQSADDGEPAFSAAGGRLAFSTDDDGIWIRNLATDAVRQVTRQGADPDWSSRNWIAFERGGQIWRVRPGGRELEQLTRRGGISPAWSPHGTKLAFVRHGTIVVLDLSSGRLGRAFGGNSPVDLAWSPDGRRIAWTSFDGSLYTARTNGTRVRTVVTGGVGGTYNLSTAGLDWQLRR